MSNEARITASLQIQRGNLQYQSTPPAFQADVSVGRGPSPGIVRVSTTGTPIDLSALDRPGLARVQNLSDVDGNYVTLGVYDGSGFFPMVEYLPGECSVFRLSRFVNEEFTTGAATGTGTDVNQLWAVAALEDADLRFEAFDT